MESFRRCGLIAEHLMLLILDFLALRLSLNTIITAEKDNLFREHGIHFRLRFYP